MISSRPITQRPLLFGLILFLAVITSVVLIAEFIQSGRQESVEPNVEIIVNETPPVVVFGNPGRPAGERVQCDLLAEQVRRHFTSIADGATDEATSFSDAITVFRRTNCELRIHTGEWRDLVAITTVALAEELMRDQLEIYGVAAMPEPGASLNGVFDQYTIRSPHVLCRDVAGDTQPLEDLCNERFRTFVTQNRHH